VSARHLATAVLALGLAGARVRARRRPETHAESLAGQRRDARSADGHAAPERAILRAGLPVRADPQLHADHPQRQRRRRIAPTTPAISWSSSTATCRGIRASRPWDINCRHRSTCWEAISAYPGVRAARYALASSNYSVARTAASRGARRRAGIPPVILDGRLVDIARENDSVSRQQVTAGDGAGPRRQATARRPLPVAGAGERGPSRGVRRDQSATRGSDLAAPGAPHRSGATHHAVRADASIRFRWGPRYTDTAGLAVTPLRQSADSRRPSGGGRRPVGHTAPEIRGRCQRSMPASRLVMAGCSTRRC